MKKNANALLWKKGKNEINKYELHTQKNSKCLDPTFRLFLQNEVDPKRPPSDGFRTVRNIDRGGLDMRTSD